MFARYAGRILTIRGLLVLFGVGVLMAGAGVSWAGEEVMVDGVVHINNGAEPPGGTKRLELKELWRVGGEGDEDNLFGVIVQALNDEAGNIYLLDMQLAEVQVFSPDGEKIKTLSGQGQGPGEVTTPTDMCMLTNGNVGLVQMFPGKLVCVDREGVPAGDITFGGSDPTQGGFRVVIDSKCRAGNLVLAGIAIMQSATGQDRTAFLARFDEAGEEQVRYLSQESDLNFQKFEIIEKDQYFVYPRRWAIGNSGEVYASPARDEFIINVYAKEGTLQRVISREYENRKRTEEELDRIRSAFEAQTAQIPGGAHTEISDTEPIIGTLSVGPDGSLWVNHNRSGFEQPEGTLITYDVFDPKGHYTHKLAVMCDGDGSNDGFFMLSAGRAILVKGLVSGAMALQGGPAGGGGDEDADEAPMEIICYQVKS